MNVNECGADVQSIRLEYGEWTFDETKRLGPEGGFGEVFGGRGTDQDVAVKRLKLSVGAASHREMKIGAALAERTHDHVVPILDHGQDSESDRYFLVMPVCDRSLQDAIATDGVFTFEETKVAALNIISGLIEVKDIVHRDLKPGNVLWHEGLWKVADFGIAKFVEDATSLESLRTSLTPAYAAPEQWRGERPTNATDVYALGCIIVAMMTGRPPFVGSTDDIREAHLQRPAATLLCTDSRLAGLVAMMLRKSPSSRPSLERCALVLSSVQAPSRSAGRSAIAAAGHAVSQEEAAAEAARMAKETLDRERRELVIEANSELRAIIARLFDAIDAEADSARRERNAIILGPAHLVFGVTERSYAMPLEGRNGSYQTGWDVAANAFLMLRADRGPASQYDPGYYEFGATLVFASTHSDSEFRWREMSFHEVFTNRGNFEQPFALDPFGRDFHGAVSNVMSKHQIAHGPLTIDGEDEDFFHERWLGLFAKAAARQLAPPNQLPLPDSFVQ
jgi:serine/threonine-protein kinase